jgi:hypothetical protein
VPQPNMCFLKNTIFYFIERVVLDFHIDNQVKWLMPMIPGTWEAERDFGSWSVWAKVS